MWNIPFVFLYLFLLVLTFSHLRLVIKYYHYLQDDGITTRLQYILDFKNQL